MFIKKGLVIVTYTIVGLFSTGAYSQIGGISTDLIKAYNAQTVSKNSLQFEPTFNYARSLGFYNSEGEYKNTAGVDVYSNLFFRGTYGVTEYLEIGSSLSTQLTMLNLGAKLHLLGNETFGIALLGGFNIDIRNGIRLLSSLDRQYVFGLAGNLLLTEEFTLNGSIQFQDIRQYEGIDYFVNTELGYKIKEKVTGVVGVGYNYYSNSELVSSNLFTLYPGFVLVRNQVRVLIQGQFDLFGKNTTSSTGMRVSLTQIIN